MNNFIESKSALTFDNGRIKNQGEYLKPEVLYKDLIARVHEYHPSDDITMIEKGYNIAMRAHEGQLRKSGEPYIIHPLSVAIILADLQLDKETITAGLLHDVVEDTILTKEEIEEMFGKDVALLVDGVTKLAVKIKDFKKTGNSGEGDLEKASGENRAEQRSKSDAEVLHPMSRQEIQAESLRKMFLATAKDIRVILIKLADRLHNMRTLSHMPAEKQQRIAQETLDIYCPIANSLGISKVKVELDDLSLKYLKPDIYYQLVEEVEKRKAAKEKAYCEIEKLIHNKMNHAGIACRIDVRIKHIYSIYNKMFVKRKSWDEIYDLLAVRIIVDPSEDVKDDLICYNVLGLVHGLFKPLPGRIKDYIAWPKLNQYQSLHTTLISNKGQPFEVQIRTLDMHKEAEYGVAAHWKYREMDDGTVQGELEEEKLLWLNQILQWQRSMTDNKEYMESVKGGLSDYFSESVYCFTPRGESRSIPAGSTPIDFAYIIHTAVGNTMVGARVNGKKVELDYRIKNGDRVEILTDPQSTGPKLEWVDLAHNTTTKTKIKQWFKREEKEENIVQGRELIAACCKSVGIPQEELLKEEYKNEFMRKYNFRDWTAVEALVGFGGLREEQVITRLRQFYDRDHQKELTDDDIIRMLSEKAGRRKSRESHIQIKGIKNVDAHFSKCCNPVPGDDIVGFVTRGRGVSIHRRDCTNLKRMVKGNQGRVIDASWCVSAGDRKDSSFLAEVNIYSKDRPGLLSDIAKVFADYGADIRRISSMTGSKAGYAVFTVAFIVAGSRELNEINNRLLAVEGIETVRRPNSSVNV